MVKSEAVLEEDEKVKVVLEEVVVLQISKTLFVIVAKKKNQISYSCLGSVPIPKDDDKSSNFLENTLLKLSHFQYIN